jgi:hypothetical protein
MDNRHSGEHVSAPLCYIAGPFRAPTQWLIALNVRIAEWHAFELCKLGYFPVVPHKNTENFHGALPDEFFLDGYLELMKRCDAVFLLPRHAESEGTKAELALARELNMPVLVNMEEAKHWADELKARP